MLEDDIYAIFDKNAKVIDMYERADLREYYDLKPEGIPWDEYSYFNLYFRADVSRNIYRRENYDILTFLGDMGGLLDILLAIGWTFTSFLTSRLVMAELVRNVYKIQRRNRDSSKLFDTKDGLPDIITGHL